MLFQLPGSMNLKHRNYIQEIDNLRGVAVLAVVLNHISSSYLKFGFLGVDVFFIISGFVVTMSLLGRDKVEFQPLEFYSKRIRRLMPASIFCILICFILSLFLLDKTFSKVSNENGAFSLIALSNFYLIKSSQNYFAQPTSLNLFTHTWSLSVEEQYYFLYPFFLFFLGGFKKRWRNLFYGLILVTLVSLSFFLFSKNENFAYYALVPRLWQLSVGALVYVFSSYFRVGSNEKLMLNLSLTLIIFLLFVGTFSIQITAIAISISTATVLYALSMSATNGFLQWKVMNVLGRMSYSVYLWHWPILALFRNTIGLDGYLQIAAMVLIAIFSSFSFFVIEKYFREKKYVSHKKTIVWALLIVSILFCSIYSLRNKSLYIGNSPPTFSLIENSKWNSALCSVSAGTKTNVSDLDVLYQSCKLVDFKAREKKRVFVYGDSYAQQLMTALVDLAKERDISLFAMATSGCHPMENFSIKVDKTLDRCGERLGLFKGVVRQSVQPGDSVVFAFSNSYFMEDNVFKYPNSLSKESAKEIFSRSLKNYSTELGNKGTRFYMVGNIPQLNIEPSLCYQPWSHLRKDCELQTLIDSKLTGERATVDAFFKAISAKNFNFISIMDFLREHISENNLYYNSSHLSSQGALKLKKILEEIYI